MLLLSSYNIYNMKWHYIKYVYLVGCNIKYSVVKNTMVYWIYCFFLPCYGILRIHTVMTTSMYECLIVLALFWRYVTEVLPIQCKTPKTLNQYLKVFHMQRPLTFQTHSLYEDMLVTTIAIINSRYDLNKQDIFFQLNRIFVCLISHSFTVCNNMFSFL